MRLQSRHEAGLEQLQLVTQAPHAEQCVCVYDDKTLLRRALSVSVLRALLHFSVFNVQGKFVLKRRAAPECSGFSKQIGTNFLLVRGLLVNEKPRTCRLITNDAQTIISCLLSSHRRSFLGNLLV